MFFVLSESLVEHQPEKLCMEYVRILQLRGLIKLSKLLVSFDICDHKELREELMNFVHAETALYHVRQQLDQLTAQLT